MGDAETPFTRRFMRYCMHSLLKTSLQNTARLDAVAPAALHTCNRNVSHASGNACAASMCGKCPLSRQCPAVCVRMIAQDALQVLLVEQGRVDPIRGTVNARPQQVCNHPACSALAAWRNLMSCHEWNLLRQKKALYACKFVHV